MPQYLLSLKLCEVLLATVFPLCHPLSGLAQVCLGLKLTTFYEGMAVCTHCGQRFLFLRADGFSAFTGAILLIPAAFS